MDIDIIFLSYDEPNADDNWHKLKDRYPHAKRVHGIKGIWEAHCECAKVSRSDHFFLVDGDNEILPEFDFELELNKINSLDGETFVWRSKNPVNDLISGFGGVKLFSKSIFQSPCNSIEISKANAKKYVRVPKMASITHFNASPFTAWRSAFRDCAKLASRINGESEKSRIHRLKTWCEKGHDRLYGEWAICGARAGKKYGESNKDTIEKIILVNNFDWLLEQFTIHEKMKNNISKNE